MTLTHPESDAVTTREVRGVVEHGNAWGRILGFPTANLPLDDDSLDGVWAGTVVVEHDEGETVHTAAISVGTRPTYYGDGIRLLEAHLLDFEGDLYDLPIRVSLHRLLRGQERYESSEALMEQLRVDVEDVRAWARGSGS